MVIGLCREWVFPVDLGGPGELHVAFPTESRTRSLGWSYVQEIRVGSSSICTAAGPPGLDELLGPTFHHENIDQSFLSSLLANPIASFWKAANASCSRLNISAGSMTSVKW